jgi:hypothetical protein
MVQVVCADLYESLLVAASAWWLQPVAAAVAS